MIPFLLFRLSAAAGVVVNVEPIIIAVAAVDRTVVVDAVDRTIEVPASDRTILIPDVRG